MFLNYGYRNQPVDTKTMVNFSTRLFYPQTHFVFPCLVMVILIFTIKSWNPKGKNLNNQFLKIAIIFLSCYSKNREQPMAYP